MGRTQKQYSTYSIEVQQQMLSILKFLKDKYTTIQAEWQIALSMLADNLQMFCSCREQIKEDGLMITNRFGVAEKHPLIKVQTDAQIQIVKLLNEFGLTPKSVAKLKVEEQENTEEFIQSLIS